MTVTRAARRSLPRRPRRHYARTRGRRALFLLAYAGLAATGPSFALVGVCFVAAGGLAIGCAETAEHAAVAHLAPEGIRGSAFGLLAAIHKRRQPRR